MSNQLKDLVVLVSSKVAVTHTDVAKTVLHQQMAQTKKVAQVR